jgi:hypothetical protein
MKKLIALAICCFMTIMSYSQTKTLNTVGPASSPTFEITTTPITCDVNSYQSLSLINHTNNTIVVSFDIEFYWSTNPSTPTTGDEVHTYTLGPNETLSGDCVNTQLLKWSSGPITNTSLSNIVITNITIN